MAMQLRLCSNTFNCFTKVRRCHMLFNVASKLIPCAKHMISTLHPSRCSSPLTYPYHEYPCPSPPY